jgi:hypothetical protein
MHNNREGVKGPAARHATHRQTFVLTTSPPTLYNYFLASCYSTKLHCGIVALWHCRGQSFLNMAAVTERLQKCHSYIYFTSFMKLKVMFNENKKGVDGSINRIVKTETMREG